MNTSSNGYVICFAVGVCVAASAALALCASLLAPIRSATASACMSSIFPARNARRVNSPGSAGRAPPAHAALAAFSTRYGFP